MAVRGDVLAHPDALVFPAPAEVRPVLHRRPFPGAAEILNAERWLDADRGAVHPACHRMGGAILEDRLARRALKAVGAGKLVVRAQRPADVVPALPAWDVLKASRDLQPAAQFFAAAELYTQAEDRFAA